MTEKDFEFLIGTEADEALFTILKNEIYTYSVRVVKEDGEAYFLTQDVDLKRVNIIVVNGKVVEIDGLY